MQSQTYEPTSEHESRSAVVKVTGSLEIVRAIVAKLECQFYAVRTSEFRHNDEDSGVHVFLRVLGVRE